MTERVNNRSNFKRGQGLNLLCGFVELESRLDKARKAGNQALEIQDHPGK